MNKQNQQNTGNGAKTADQTQSSGPSISTPTFTRFERMPDKQTAADEVEHEVRPKDAVKEPASVKPPMRAAMGSDDLMSQQQQQSLPSVDEIKGKWKQQVGAAKIAWGKLTEDELLRSEGHEQKLAGLVQERYAITRDEADKQIKSFFAKYNS